MAEKTENRPIVIFGAKIPSRTASFYKALGVPLGPQKPGVTHHFVGDLDTHFMHVVTSPDPPGILGIAFATLIPSIHVAVTRLCADGHIDAADAIDIRETPVRGGKNITRHALLKDPEGRTVLLVENQQIPARRAEHH